MRVSSHNRYNVARFSRRVRFPDKSQSSNYYRHFRGEGRYARRCAVPAASGASLEQDTAVAGMAVSFDNYYASSQTPEADIIDYIRYIVASAQEKKIIPVVNVNATTKEDGSVVFGTSLVSKDASEKEEGLVSVMASLNVRNKPSVSSNVIGYLYSNCVVSIYDTVDNSEGSWYLIKSGDVEGYVSSDYVLTGAAAKANDEDLTNLGGN